MIFCILILEGLAVAFVVLIVWLLDLQLPMQLVPFTTNVMSTNLDQGEVCNIMW